MLFRISVCAVFVGLGALAQTPAPLRATINWDDRPGLNFDPASTPDHPCGVGTPARGRILPEIDPDTAAAGVALTVRQDPNRLCYVFGGVAEAPVIRIRQGRDLAITLRNEITDPAAIEDYVAAQSLDQPNAPVSQTAGYAPVTPGMHHEATGATNLHVHGFAVPPVVPQDEVMQTCVDPAIGEAGCGRRAFTYRYRIPPTMPAGLYWYHPHVHGEVQAQMLMGLSGAIVVEGPDDDLRRAAHIEDRVFVIRQSQDHDPKLTALMAQIPGVVLPEPPHYPPHPTPDAGGLAIDTDHELACSSNAGVDRITLNGSKVIDGRVKDADVAPVVIPAGALQLWRVVNAATDAYLDLSVVDQNGGLVPLRIVARDGARLADDSGRPIALTTTDYQLVPPAGRLEFLVPAPPPGEKAYLVSHAVDTGCVGDKVPERKLALITAGPPIAPEIALAQAEFASGPTRSSGDSAGFFDGILARPTDRVRTLVLAEYPRPGSVDRSDFYIMERRPGARLEPFAMGGPPTITTRAGAVEEWVIENWTNELHAFHIHQLHFRVLEVNGGPVEDSPLLDTVNVPYATSGDVTNGAIPVTPGRVRLKLFFPEALAGDILFHCHLVDHEDNGMMGMLRVLPSNAALPLQKTEIPGNRSVAALLANPPMCRPATAASQSQIR